MAIKLEKQSSISLEKIGGDLSKLSFGMEWTTKLKRFDIDINAFICKHAIRDGKSVPQLLSNEHIVIWSHQESADGAFKAAGDDLGADGAGSEMITGDLSKLDKDAEFVDFVAYISNARKRNQHFGQVDTGRIVIENSETGDELLYSEFSPGEFDGVNAIHLGRLTVKDGVAEFAALRAGEDVASDSILTDILVKGYGFDVSANA